MNNTILIRFGGVLVPRLDQTLIYQIKKIKGGKITKQIEIDIIRICEDYYTCSIKGNELFSKIIEKTSIQMSEAEFLKKVISDCTCTEEVLGFINNLKRNFTLQLLVDYPYRWFWGILRTCKISELFPEISYILLSNGQQNFSGPSKPKEQVISNTNLIIIEPDVKCAMRYIKKGIQVIHFINCSRTIRELGLRNLLSV